ncbi:nascent polypeptide-associated complex subunit alpha, muscle-specific form-like isoform X2 [Prinia subflava]|uniref:nascent polypeptide-associated complex subunit alpha, muscle-specific form-like isoform X2 n=1 Tax=Prinia subflava TaxID=208062 RepID=UPI002FE3C094
MSRAPMKSPAAAAACQGRALLCATPSLRGIPPALGPERPGGCAARAEGESRSCSARRRARAPESRRGTCPAWAPPFRLGTPGTPGCRRSASPEHAATRPGRAVPVSQAASGAAGAPGPPGHRSRPAPRSSRPGGRSPTPDWDAGNGFSTPLLEDSLDPVEPPTGVAAGWNSPPSLLVPAHKPSSHRRAKPVAEGDLASQPTSRTEPMGTRSDPLEDDEGAAGTTARVPDPQKGVGSGFCQGIRCLLELMAIVAGGELVFMLCCIGIWYCWKRKRHLLEEKLKAGGWSRDLYNQKSNSSSSESDQFIFAPPSSVTL